MSGENLLTAQELATRLRVSPVTVRDWTRTGSIPAIRVGRRWRYRLDDVVAAFQREAARGDEAHGS